MQPCYRIHYSTVHWQLNMFQAVCRSKHVELSMNGGIINSVTRLHLVGCFYWVILWCMDPWILNLQNSEKVIRIIPNSRMRDSCRELFQRLEILPLYSQYIFSLSIFVIKHKHLNNTNNQIHRVHTRFKTNLHPLIANLTKFQKGVYHSGLKTFNNLPHDIKDLANEITYFGMP